MLGASTVRPFLRAVSGLRFFAAFHVIAFHTFQAGKLVENEWLRNWVGAGYTGVSFFFVLSGFVIGYSYLGQLPLPKARRRFWKARLLRIYPSYFISILPGLVAFIWFQLSSGAFNPRAFGGASLALALGQSWYPPIAMLWNPPAWSLSVEAFFYMLFPFVAGSVLRVQRPGRIVLLILVLYCLGLSETLVFLHNKPLSEYLAANSTLGDFSTEFVKFFPVMHLHEFLIGLLASRFLTLRTELAFFSERIGSALQWLSAGLIVGICSVSPQIPYFLLHNGLMAPLAAILLLMVSMFPDTVLARFFGSRPLVVLGNASYALYIFHMVLDRLLPDSYHRALVASPLLPGALFIAGNLLVSVVYYEVVERRFQKIGRRVLGIH
ncbi:MAG: acyltransferase [Bdellovibrionaceae bacterium]|nr:acyltransferase [Bdellovibrionales bacterium]MCB9254474.1 acyltransferase [Pseudobdellovibrionaceae bacterium]